MTQIFSDSESHLPLSTPDHEAEAVEGEIAI